MVFVRQALRLMRWIGPLLVVSLGWIFGWRAAIGVASGMGWSLANLWVTTGLVQTSLQQTPRARWWGRATLWMFKLPILYSIGIYCIVSRWSSPVGFLVGFSLWPILLCMSAVRTARA